MDDFTNISTADGTENDVDDQKFVSGYSKSNSTSEKQTGSNQDSSQSAAKVESNILPEMESSSATDQNRPSPYSGEDGDRDFDYGGDTGEYEDDEETLEEEEAVGDGDDAEELNDLAKEGEMPLDDLLALYYNKQENNADYNSNEDNQFDEFAAGLIEVFSSELKSSPSEDKNGENESDENEDLTRQLRSNTNSLLSPTHQQFGDEEDDRDYVPPAPDDWKKSPRVGDDYQAENIPETKRQNPDYDDNDDQLVWDPTVMPEEEVASFLKSVGEARDEGQAFPLPAGSHLRDNEDALFLLSQTNGDTEEAARKFRMRPNHLANEVPVWTEEECQCFEAGLTVYGKDFHAIHQNRLKTKSIGEIVKFYYIWKKSARYDHFNAKTRLGKKKDTMHPGVTDYMERLLDETEYSISHHNNHPNAASSSYPPPLSHAAALQQHFADIRNSRRQNRQQLQSGFEAESPSADYLGANGLVDGEYPDEIDMLDGLVPTLSANHILPPVSFSSIESGLNVGYSSVDHFAPISSNHHPEIVQIGPLPANQNNNSHVIASNPLSLPFQVAQPNEAKRSIGNVSVSGLLHTTPLPPDVLLSIDELETTCGGSSSSNASSSHSLTQSFPSDHSTSVESPSEREQQTLNLKRYHCPAGDGDAKRRRSGDVAIPPAAIDSSSPYADKSGIPSNASDNPVTRHSLSQSERKEEDVSIDTRSIVRC